MHARRLVYLTIGHLAVQATLGVPNIPTLKINTIPLPPTVPSGTWQQWGHLETMQKLWEWGKNNLTIEDISNKLLFGTDKEGRSIWKFAAMNGHFETLDKLWEWAKENLATEEINNKLFFGTDNAGRTVWHLAKMGGHLETM